MLVILLIVFGATAITLDQKYDSESIAGLSQWLTLIYAHLSDRRNIFVFSVLSVKPLSNNKSLTAGLTKSSILYFKRLRKINDFYSINLFVDDDIVIYFKKDEYYKINESQPINGFIFGEDDELIPIYLDFDLNKCQSYSPKQQMSKGFVSSSKMFYYE